MEILGNNFFNNKDIYIRMDSFIDTKEIYKIESILEEKSMIKRIPKNINKNRSYNQCLLDLTRDELTKIRKNWEFKGVSRLKKAELVEFLCEEIPKNLYEALSYLDLKSINCIKDTIKNNFLDLDFDILHFLRNELGFLFWGYDEKDRFFSFFPDEIKCEIEDQLSCEKLNQSIKENQVFIENVKHILDYLGAINISEISFLMKEKKLEKFLNGYCKRNADLILKNDILCLKEVLNPKKLLENQKNKKIDRILQNENMFLSIKNEENKILNIFKNEMKMNEVQAKNNVYKIIRKIQANKSIASILEEFLQENRFYNVEILKKMNSIIICISRKIPKWADSDLESKGLQKKINRNDPCYCGSNLKYKKCCGKNK